MFEITVVLNIAEVLYIFLLYCLFLWRNIETRAWTASLLRLLHSTHLYTLTGSPLNESSVRREGRYLHNT